MFTREYLLRRFSATIYISPSLISYRKYEISPMGRRGRPGKVSGHTFCGMRRTQRMPGRLPGETGAIRAPGERVSHDSAPRLAASEGQGRPKVGSAQETFKEEGRKRERKHGASGEEARVVEIEETSRKDSSSSEKINPGRRMRGERGSARRAQTLGMPPRRSWRPRMPRRRNRG